MRFFLLFTTAFADKCWMGIGTPQQFPALLREIIREPPPTIDQPEGCIDPFGRDKDQAVQDPLGIVSYAGVSRHPKGGGFINSCATHTWVMRKI